MDLDELLEALATELRTLRDVDAREAEHEPDWVEMEARGEKLPTELDRARNASQITQLRLNYGTSRRLSMLQQRSVEMMTLMHEVGAALQSPEPVKAGETLRVRI